jgi:hypothetical protein
MLFTPVSDNPAWKALCRMGSYCMAELFEIELDAMASLEHIPDPSIPDQLTNNPA